VSSQYLAEIERSFDLWQKREYDGAMFALEHALDMPEADHRALVPLLALYCDCGEPDNAVRLCAAMARDGAPRERFVTPEVAYQFGKSLICIYGAVSLWLQFLGDRFGAAYPDSPLSACLLAHHYYERKRYTKAIAAGKRQRNLGGRCMTCDDIVACSSAVLGVEGLPLARADPDLSSQTVKELWRTACQAGMEGECDIAPVVWSRVVERLHRRSDALHTLGTSYLRNKQWIDALRVFDEVLATVPRHVWALNGRAYAITMAMGKRQATEAWRDVLERAPWLFSVWRFRRAYGIKRFLPNNLRLGWTKARAMYRFQRQIGAVVNWMFPKKKTAGDATVESTD